ncbi:unnamed protein product, partial [marine sediment metagenome]
DSSGQGNDGDMTGHAATWVVAPKDSTQYGNTLTANGDPTAGPDGKIGVGVVLDGTDDWLYGNYNNFDNASAGTFEFWLYYDTAVAPDGFLTSDNVHPGIHNSGGDDFRVQLDSSSGRVFDLYPNGTISTGVWMHFVATFNSTIAIMYKNGDNVGEDTTPATAYLPFDEATDYIHIGTDREIGGRDVDGTMDEVRISNIVRGAAWITASYETDIDHLLDWGGEETYEETVDWLSGWEGGNRVEFTADHNDIDADLTDFPALVYISTSSGIYSDDISFIFDELDAGGGLGSYPNRKKIAVTKGDGTTQLYVEIEKWDDGATGNERAWLWVKAAGTDSISSATDTDFYFYYDSSQDDNTTYVGDSGSRTEVWDSNYIMV